MKRLALAVILGLAGAATAQPVARPVAAAAFQLNGEAVQGGRMIGTAPAGTVALILETSWSRWTPMAAS